ncbi:hypothetical protein ACMDB5_07115 [Flavobacterium sp. W1B]|uniref:hypothetical protein n=1 Tax=Flavobacterium sp. W1B TaxID=3394146 RepID=UPI0039BC7DAD
MNNFSTVSNNKKSFTFYIILATVLLFNVAAFSQSTENNTVVSVSNNSEITNDAKQETVVRSSNLEFVLWFMTSKQNPNSTISNEGASAKKQIMTSGLTPNRLLMKAFLKKAVNFESALA